MIPAPPHEQELADPEGKAEQDEGHASYPTLTNPSAPTETFAPTRPPAELGGPPSARAGLPTQSLDPGVLAGVREAIQRQVVYPALARRLGWQGRATVAFHLSAGGQVENLRVLGSSGRDLLDSAALQAVARASPLPARGSPLEVVMPVVFALR